MSAAPAPRGRFGLPLVVLAAIAASIATYLTWQHVAGVVPPCGPVRGCETVLTSPYATVAGIPVALPGALASLAILGGTLAWWLWADRRGLMVAYLTGMASVAVLAYLTFLEVAVIGAICAWCVTYAVFTLAGWLLAVATLGTTRAVEP